MNNIMSGARLLFLLLLYTTHCIAQSGWVPQNLLPNLRLNAICLTSNLNYATIIGDSGTILRSSDGAWSWAAQESGTKVALHAVAFSDSNTGR